MKFYSFLFSLFAMFVICLFTMPALQPSYAQVTVVDKIAGNTVTAEEFTQLVQALKGTKACNIIISATFQLPNAETAQTVTGATGQLYWDDTDGVAIVQTGSATKVLAHTTFQHSFYIPGVTAASSNVMWSTRTIPVWIAPKDMAVTITQISVAGIGGASFSAMFTEKAFASLNTNPSADTHIYSVTQNIDGNEGGDVTTFTNAGIAAKAHVCLKVEDVTGTTEAGGMYLDGITGVIYYEKAIE